MTTDQLWNPDQAKPLASPSENQRVYEIYQEEKLRRVGPGHPMGHGKGGTCSTCGDFRGDFARDWVQVAIKAGLRVPGEKARKPLREDETELERRVDAARTRIRHFERGDRQYDWVLIGIETTIADRNGMAYPGRAYQTQERLNI